MKSSCEAGVVAAVRSWFTVPAFVEIRRARGAEPTTVTGSSKRRSPARHRQPFSFMPKCNIRGHGRCIRLRRGRRVVYLPASSIIGRLCLGVCCCSDANHVTGICSEGFQPPRIMMRRVTDYAMIAFVLGLYAANIFRCQRIMASSHRK